jgi:hypothetical protein
MGPVYQRYEIAAEADRLGSDDGIPAYYSIP